MDPLVSGAGAGTEGNEVERFSRLFERLDDLLGNLDQVSRSIRSLSCERRAAEQPHRPAQCRLVRPCPTDDLLTADGRQAACRACLT